MPTFCRAVEIGINGPALSAISVWLERFRGRSVFEKVSGRGGLRELDILTGLILDFRLDGLLVDVMSSLRLAWGRSAISAARAPFPKKKGWVTFGGLAIFGAGIEDTGIGDDVPSLL